MVGLYQIFPLPGKGNSGMVKDDLGEINEGNKDTCKCVLCTKCESVVSCCKVKCVVCGVRVEMRGVCECA
jgi:hypothetical protein